MIRRKYGGGIRGQIRSGRNENTDVNPMESIANLVDAMLVLAVGMMLAVIINWNVELDSLIDADEIDASQLNDDQIEEVEEDQALQEKGMVYQDPETGKYYIKVEE